MRVIIVWPRNRLILADEVRYPIPARSSGSYIVHVPWLGWPIWHVIVKTLGLMEAGVAMRAACDPIASSC